MAKAILNALITGLSGKICGNSKLIFRRNPSGSVSIYKQKMHKRKSLHSPAQELHRQLIGRASAAASIILSNPDSEEYSSFNEQFIQHCKNTRGKQYCCLRSFIIHCLFKKYKQESQ